MALLTEQKVSRSPNEMDYHCNDNDYIIGCTTLDKFTSGLEPEVDNA